MVLSSLRDFLAAGFRPSDKSLGYFRSSRRDWPDSRLKHKPRSLFGQARFQIELKTNAAGEVVTALVQSPTPFRTRALKKPTRKRPSSVDCQN